MKRAAPASPASPASPGACSPAEAGAMALRVLVTGSTGYAPWHSKTFVYWHGCTRASNLGRMCPNPLQSLCNSASLISLRVALELQQN